MFSHYLERQAGDRNENPSIRNKAIAATVSGVIKKVMLQIKRDLFNYNSKVL